MDFDTYTTSTKKVPQKYLTIEDTVERFRRSNKIAEERGLNTFPIPPTPQGFYLANLDFRSENKYPLEKMTIVEATYEDDSMHVAYGFNRKHIHNVSELENKTLQYIDEIIGSATSDDVKRIRLFDSEDDRRPHRFVNYFAAISEELDKR